MKCKNAWNVFRANPNPCQLFIMHYPWISCTSEVQNKRKRNELLFCTSLGLHYLCITEMNKLDSWADDMKLGLEKEISDLDNEIRLRNQKQRNSPDWKRKW